METRKTIFLRVDPMEFIGESNALEFNAKKLSFGSEE
jgi:hypothetical protein